MTAEKKQRIISQNFGSFLKRFRLQKGFTLKKLSDETGISQAYLSKLETGQRRCPSIVIIQSISRALGMGDSLVSIASGSDCVLNSIQNVLSKNTFSINGKSINTETKLCLLKIIDFIISKDTDLDKVDNVVQLINYVKSLRKNL